MHQALTIENLCQDKLGLRALGGRARDRRGAGRQVAAAAVALFR